MKKIFTLLFSLCSMMSIFAQISDYEFTGRTLIHHPQLLQEQSINLNDLEKGTYFVKLKVGNQQEVKKIIKI